MTPLRAAVRRLQIWQQRSAQFRSGGDQIAVLLRMDPARRSELVSTALAVLTEEVDDDGWLRLAVTFPDIRHAVWALWQLGTGAEAVAPQSLRSALHDRAAEIVTRYAALS